MPHILEKPVRLDYPLGRHLHLLIAQLPNRVVRTAGGWRVAEPDEQWRTIRSVLDLVGDGRANWKKLHYLLLPESVLPAARLDEALDLLRDRFPCNSVTMLGVEHVPLREYRALLERFGRDNADAIPFVDRDIDAGEILDVPVNFCVVAVKEDDGRLRVFLEAKSHPFRGEEFLDVAEDLYRGRHFWLFRSELVPWNFMAILCLDYVYRSLFESNIRQVVDHADRLFFRTRQRLDALFVLQTNPKPEHRAYRDVLTGFYGELLEDTPGVRDTVTVFGNASDESALGDAEAEGTFGASSVVLGPAHRLGHSVHEEFSTDDLDGAPLWRLRFGTGTRLYYLNLPLHHELDPRTSRVPLKLHAVMRRAADGGWERVRTAGRALELPDEVVRH